MAFMNHKKRKRCGAFLLLPVLLLLTGCVEGVSAKYIQQREQNVVARAKDFYFSSDLLTVDNATYEINSGSSEITFSLSNHIDELRYSELTVQYDVYVNDELLGSGVLDAANTDDEFTLQVEDGQTYEVRAVGRAGYEKEILAIFKVLQNSANFYKHLDTSNTYYVLLTVWTEDIAGDVTVIFPADLIPDNTDPKLAGVVNYADGQYESGTTPPAVLEAYSSQVYRFFKNDLSKSYNIEEFTVTMGGIEAIAGTP